MRPHVCTAADAIYKLAAGNLKYLNAETGSGDISRRIRSVHPGRKGRVALRHHRHLFGFPGPIPENIFSAGIGELFVIRLAGNIIDDHQLGEHRVRCRPSGLSGWWWCWATPTAARWMRPSTPEPSGYIRYITDEIKKAIGDETDPYKASCLNVRHSVQEIEKSLCIHNIEEETGLRVVGAMYHIEDGSVEFL